MCRKAFDVDLAAFLRDPGASELAEFRAHYPRCPDCSAEVHAWTEVHRQLQSAGIGREDVHPAPELLLRFEDQRHALAAGERQTVEQHLATCRSCRDELAALRSFDFTALHTPAGAARRSPRALTAEFLSWLRGVLRHPAFAYALVLMLLYPAVIARVLKPDLSSVPQAPIPSGAPAADELRGSQPAPNAAAPAERADAPSDQSVIHNLIAAAPRSARLAEHTEHDATAETALARAAVRSERGTAAGALPVQPNPAAREETADVHNQSLARAMAPQQAAPPAGPAAPVIELRHGERALIAGTAVSQGVTLRVPVPQTVGQALAAEGFTEPAHVEVRVTSPGDRREIRERFPSSQSAPQLDVRLPSGWLSPGDYKVELYIPLTRPSPNEVFEFAVR